MENINTRIAVLRKELDLSMEKFGNIIGVTKSSINNIEKGVNNPSERTIKLICKEFNVNQDWLVNGNGSMFVELTREEEIAKYFGTLLKDDDMEFQKKFIRALSKLSVDEWKMIEDFIDELKKD
jgi:hypothetical protein